MVFTLSLPLIFSCVGCSARWGIWMFYICIYIYISSSTLPSAKHILRDFRMAVQIKQQQSICDPGLWLGKSSCCEVEWFVQGCFESSVFRMMFPNFLDFHYYGFTLYCILKLKEFLQIKTSDTGRSEISDWFNSARNKMRLYLLNRHDKNVIPLSSCTHAALGLLLILLCLRTAAWFLLAVSPHSREGRFADWIQLLPSWRPISGQAQMVRGAVKSLDG